VRFAALTPALSHGERGKDGAYICMEREKDGAFICREREKDGAFI
jgi:hypothetical protein